MTICNVPILHKFQVFDEDTINLSQDAILGIDFLQKCNIKIQFFKNNEQLRQIEQPQHNKNTIDPITVFTNFLNYVKAYTISIFISLFQEAHILNMIKQPSTNLWCTCPGCILADLASENDHPSQLILSEIFNSWIIKYLKFNSIVESFQEIPRIILRSLIHSKCSSFRGIYREIGNLIIVEISSDFTCPNCRSSNTTLTNFSQLNLHLTESVQTSLDMFLQHNQSIEIKSNCAKCYYTFMYQPRYKLLNLPRMLHLKIMNQIDPLRTTEPMTHFDISNNIMITTAGNRFDIYSYELVSMLFFNQPQNEGIITETNDDFRCYVHKPYEILNKHDNTLCHLLYKLNNVSQTHNDPRVSHFTNEIERNPSILKKIINMKPVKALYKKFINKSNNLYASTNRNTYIYPQRKSKSIRITKSMINKESDIHAHEQPNYRNQLSTDSTNILQTIERNYETDYTQRNRYLNSNLRSERNDLRIYTNPDTCLQHVNPTFRDEKHLLGLVNEGTMCYANSLFQAIIYDLFNTMAHTTNLSIGHTECKCIGCILHRTTQQYNKSHTPFLPSEFHDWITLSFPPNNISQGQEDVHELYSKIYTELRNSRSTIHSERTSTIHHSLSHKLTGQIKYTTYCSKCGYQSSNTESFSNIIIPPTPSIQKSLDMNFTPEIIEKWKCHNCDQLSPSVRKSDLIDLPQIMAICISNYTNEGSKIHNNIYIDTKLNLEHFLPMETENPTARYKLLSYICHSGSDSQNGHFFTVKPSANNTAIVLNDTEIIFYNEPIDRQTGIYLLFYELQ